MHLCFLDICKGNRAGIFSGIKKMVFTKSLLLFGFSYSKISKLLINDVLYFKLRESLQTLLQGIILKPLRMPMAKLCLYPRMAPRRVAHPIMGGGGGWNAYHKKVNKFLKFKNNLHYTFYKQHSSQQKAALCK